MSPIKFTNQNTDRTVKFGIGFATGRQSFKKVLLSYINIWKETQRDLLGDADVRLSLFVFYDVEYQNAQSTDFTNLSQEIVDVFDQIVFIGAKNSSLPLSRMTEQGVLSTAEWKAVFGSGYAGKRNAVLFSAIEHQMDYLLFLDDDEYPIAVSNTEEACLWSGQRVFLSHLKEIASADFTNGYHCGYISPIPQVVFDDRLTEDTFRTFIEAISNDIISWDSIRSLMRTGGVTYASAEILSQKKTAEVPWENHGRFISGANLCINLRAPLRTLPFYNPPGARGEDTFLSTMLENRKVVKIPCYTFHDGFSFYQHILNGALPIHLKRIKGDSPKVIARFVSACIGWVRYKPLLIYITKPEEYDCEIQRMRSALEKTIPVFADHFQEKRFFNVQKEFEKYCRNVKRHYAQYRLAQSAWEKIIYRLE